MAGLPDKDIDEAWRELARHPQWRIARLKLVRMMMHGVPTGLDDGALREAVGRQSLARNLLDLTSSVSEENDGNPDEYPYLERSGPVAGPRRIGARRRIAGAAGE